MSADSADTADKIFVLLAVEHYWVQRPWDAVLIRTFQFPNGMGPVVKLRPHAKEVTVAIHRFLGTKTVCPQGCETLFVHETCARKWQPHVVTVHHPQIIQGALADLMHCLKKYAVTILWFL